MKKLLLIGAGIFLGLFALGNSLQSLQGEPQVQGVTVESTVIPTRVVELPTATPSLGPTATIVVVPTKESVVVPPTNSPTSQSGSGLSNDNYYTNSAGNEVHSPANSTNGSAPAGASAQCRDGTYSFSQSRQGTCSHHGGVAIWL